jgi:ribose transport system permease protein
MINSKGKNRPLAGFRKARSEYLGLLGVLAVEIIVFGFVEETFLSSGTFFSITAQVPDTVIAAVGMTFVLIIGGIDLSIGSVLALSQAVLGFCIVKAGWPLSAAVTACLATGILCGALSGLVTVRWALPSFIVTLGMLEIARGATYFVTQSRTIYIGQAITGVSSAIPGLGEITWSALICVVAVVAGQIVLSHHVFGRYMIAIGANEEVVRLSGINPKPIKLAVFTFCGFCAALAGMIQASIMSSASPNAGSGFELTVIAAVVIGGTSLMGGRGSVVKSFLGVLIVAVLNAGLDQMSAPEYAKRIIIGVVIVVAVILDFYRSRSSR